MRPLLLSITLSAGVVGLIAPWLSQRESTNLSAAPPLQVPVASQTTFADAKDLAWKAAVMVQHPPHSVATWRAARAKWRQAIRLLETIPAGTETTNIAQRKLAIYRANYAAVSDRLTSEKTATENFATAQRLAWQAALIVQNPPHAHQVWQQANQKWQAAILQLEMIPATTSIYQQVNQKLSTYRNNQSAIRQRLSTEAFATQTLQQFSSVTRRLENLAIASSNQGQIDLSYEAYQQLVQTLEISLKTFANQPGGRTHWLYPEFAKIVADHAAALRLWQAYLKHKQANAEWLYDDLFDQRLPVSLVDQSDLEKYRLKTYFGGSKVSLRVGLGQIWGTVGDRLFEVNQQMQNLDQPKSADAAS